MGVPAIQIGLRTSKFVPRVTYILEDTVDFVENVRNSHGNHVFKKLIDSRCLPEYCLIKTQMSKNVNTGGVSSPRAFFQYISRISSLLDGNLNHVVV